MTDITAIASSADIAIDVLERLGVLEKTRNELMNNWGPAGKYLEVVLSEIEKSYEVLDNELVKVATLAFDSPGEKTAATKYLRETARWPHAGTHSKDARTLCEIQASTKHTCRAGFPRVIESLLRK
jgi:hypothetical protein